MMPRYHLKNLGRAPVVHTLVGLARSNHGTTLDGLFTLASYVPPANAAFADCPTWAEQEADSPLITQLNTGGETVPGVEPTVIQSRDDEVVTPYTSAFLNGATNITLKARCSLDQGEHVSMANDNVADQDVVNALDAAHAVAPAYTTVAPSGS